MLKPVPAGEGGSVGSKHTSLAPGTQHGDTMDFEMDTDMIRIQNEDRSSLCAKCDGWSSLSPIYRSKTIFNTEFAWGVVGGGGTLCPPLDMHPVDIHAPLEPVVGPNILNLHIYSFLIN